MIIQIYAFTDTHKAVKAAQLGVDHVGFVAGEYGQVYGELSFTRARRMVSALPGSAISVALTMADDVDEILGMADAVRPHIIHISSDMDLVGPEKMADLRHRLPGAIRLMKAIAVTDESSILAAEKYAQWSDFLLLDSKHAGFPGVGATGLTHDWQISRQIVKAVAIPVILAGGLSDANVVEAMRIVNPYGVDSNTSTNTGGSRVDKDLEKIKAFVEAVRRFDRFDFGTGEPPA